MKINIETAEGKYIESLDYIILILNRVARGEITLSKFDFNEDEFLKDSLEDMNDLQGKLIVRLYDLCKVIIDDY